jgi:charged multivesicular body protein 2A
MSFLFGGERKQSNDSVRDFQRKVASNARGVERDIARLDQQETVLQRALAGCAKDTSKLAVATAKAQEIVRLRAHRSRLYTVKAHMTGLSQQLQTVQTSGKIQETIAMTGQMLQALNGKFDAAAIARMLADYERQNVQMTAKQELVDDALEAGFEADGEREDCNQAVADVLMEAGLDAAARLARREPAVSPAESDIAARLERLRVA